MHRYVLPCAFAMLASLCGPPVHAQEMGRQTLDLPEGCTAFLTMQSAACSVSHYFTCEGDAPGIQHRVEMDELGVSYIGYIDAETQWLYSTYRDSGHTEVLEEESADPASFSDLMDQGISTYDFRTLSDEIGPMRYVGADILTGETVTVDGIELMRTDFTIRAENEAGEVIFRIEGQEFVSPEWRTFFGGETTTTTERGTFERDSSPVEFAQPGEAGFLSANPKFGCGATDSSWEID